jgi:hypothetical protein
VEEPDLVKDILPLYDPPEEEQTEDQEESVDEEQSVTAEEQNTETNEE